MTKSDWLDLTVLERRKYNLLSEVMDLSQQLGEALDRNDDVSVRLLVSMRQDPILRLEEIKAAIGSKRDSIPPEEWERVLELDQRLNRRMAGDDSFYAQKK